MAEQELFPFQRGKSPLPDRPIFFGNVPIEPSGDLRTSFDRILTSASLDRIRQTSQDIATFVDTTNSRQDFFDTHLGTIFDEPSDVNPFLVEQQRRDVLSSLYQDFFFTYFQIEDIQNFSSKDAEPTLRNGDFINTAAIDALVTIARSQRANTQLRFNRPFSGSFDPVANNPDDPIDILLDAVFANDEMRVAWVNRSREVQAEISKRNIDLADIVATGAQVGIPVVERNGERILKKRIAIVGSSIASSVLAKTMAPYVDIGDITVIEADDVTGQRWLGREFALNSSAAPVLDLDKPRLPGIPGSETTTTSPNKRTDVVRAGQLATVNGFLQVCDDNSVRLNPSGLDVGAEAHINLTSVVADYIVGNKVLIDKTKKTRDKTVILTLQDRDGVERQMEFDVVLFATGLEQESKVPGIQEKLNQSEAFIQTYIQDIRERQNNGAVLYPINLPQFMNRRTRELLMYFWIYELQRNPELYPFLDWYNKNRTIGITGVQGDEFAVITEALIPDEQIRTKRTTPYRSDPRSFPNDVSTFAQPTIISFGGRIGERRRRYEGINLDDVFFANGKANGSNIRLIPDEYSYADLNGARGGVIERSQALVRYGDEEYGCDYVYDATGVTTASVEGELRKARIPMVDDFDTVSGLKVGRVSIRQNIFISGVANRFRFNELNSEIQNLISVINQEVQSRRKGSKEAFNNVVALFANIPLVERQAWNVFFSLPLNNDSLRQRATEAFKRRLKS